MEGKREFRILIAKAGTYFQVDPAQKKEGKGGGRGREGERKSGERAEESGNEREEVSTPPAIAAQLSLHAQMLLPYG